MGGVRSSAGADLVIPLLPAFLAQPNLGLVHNHDVKHVTLLFLPCLHLGLHRLQTLREMEHKAHVSSLIAYNLFAGTHWTKAKAVGCYCGHVQACMLKLGQAPLLWMTLMMTSAHRQASILHCMFMLKTGCTTETSQPWLIQAATIIIRTGEQYPEGITNNFGIP